LHSNHAQLPASAQQQSCSQPNPQEPWSQSHGAKRTRKRVEEETPLLAALVSWVAALAAMPYLPYRYQSTGLPKSRARPTFAVFVAGKQRKSSRRLVVGDWVLDGPG